MNIFQLSHGRMKRRNRVSFPQAILISLLGILSIIVYSSFENIETIETSIFSIFDEALSQEKKPTTVAYVVTLIHCGFSAAPLAPLADAAFVLRHSIHNISSRNPNSGSRYDYKLYALAHQRGASESCIDIVKKLGFEVIVVETPFEV